MNVLELFKNITVLVFDIDGVLTDGSVLVLPGGVLARQMNIKDGYALQLAVKMNYQILIISGGHSPESAERLGKLGVKHIFLGVSNKAECLQNFMDKHGIHPSQVLYMGDDLPDAAVMQLAGLPCCPADAATEIKHLSRYISHLGGGKGCVREVTEKVLKLRGDWKPDPLIKSR